MVINSFTIPFVTLLYYGVKDSWKFLYQTPKLSKKIKGYSEWKEVRFRYPSPGNEPVNGDLTAREMQRQHYKAPYQFSRHSVRNFWNNERDGYSYDYIGAGTDLSGWSEAQESVFLKYKKGDDIGNKFKKERYLRTKSGLEDLTNVKGLAESMQKYEDKPVSLVHDFMKMKADYDIKSDWVECGDIPGGSPYLVGPDTFLHEYQLHHWSSYDMQIYLELEKFIEDVRDEMEAKGSVPIYKGNSENWKILDNTHRPDQQIGVVKSLKQRNVKQLS